MDDNTFLIECTHCGFVGKIYHEMDTIKFTIEYCPVCSQDIECEEDIEEELIEDTL